MKLLLLYSWLRITQDWADRKKPQVTRHSGLGNFLSYTILNYAGITALQIPPSLTPCMAEASVDRRVVRAPVLFFASSKNATSWKTISMRLNVPIWRTLRHWTIDITCHKGRVVNANSIWRVIMQTGPTFVHQFYVSRKKIYRTRIPGIFERTYGQHF